MADTRSTAQQATGGTLHGIAGSPAADRLKAEARDYLGAQVERLVSGVGHKLGQGTARLTDIADGKSPGLGRLAVEGGRKLAGHNPLGSLAGKGASRLKDTVKGVLPGGEDGRKGGKKGRGKPTVLMESMDVGVPLRTAYDQWTRYQEYSGFARGVEDVDVPEDTGSDWRFKIFLSHGGYKTMTSEQLPDERIAWESEGELGPTKGVVTFHELAPRLTRLQLIMEYHPVGFVEKTGNIWRAQDRRARFDLKDFARFVSLNGEASGGRPDELRDGEVVRGDEGARAGEEEPEAAEEPAGEYEDEADYGYEQEEPAEAEDEAEGEYEEDEGEGEYEEDEGEGEYEEDEAEDAYEDGGYAEDESEAEPEAEPSADERAAARSRHRARTGARARSRR
ncbi:hypothetical protein GCM10018793_47460 [Streptomyces sulfonofaciens]|uniref:Coenzyme Q-binding protein COQ10 START domain-containing protein n=1 Tax=Streptomyces sulfonofaciens TaxID=68272 RepID=A0A919GGR2_9ACTN|nr:SRPBCC family protein [Streptomyces sulfonofaciens]GHH84066.1 hypothetical protein GCM10018793_47460 [Streptomyces sulfonofaciens]